MPFDRVKFILRRWYWKMPYQARKVVDRLPDWLLAIALGLGLAYMAAKGF